LQYNGLVSLKETGLKISRVGSSLVNIQGLQQTVAQRSLRKKLIRKYFLIIFSRPGVKNFTLHLPRFFLYVVKLILSFVGM